jgi:uncharacterized protein
VENEWKLGNVMNGRLNEMLNSPRQETFGNMKADLPLECRSCKWLNKCRGGCTKERLNNPPGEGSSRLCLSYKMFFEYADERLKQLFEQWKRARNIYAQTI